MATLAESVAAEEEPKRRKKMQDLLADLAKIPESLRDYRVRLQEYNLDTRGYRGLGAAESQMDRYSNRLKKHGQSWSLTGLRNMLAVLNAKFEGRLLEVTEKLGQAEELLPQLRQKFGVGRVKEALKTATYEPRSGGIPAKTAWIKCKWRIGQTAAAIEPPVFLDNLKETTTIEQREGLSAFLDNDLAA